MSRIAWRLALKRWGLVEMLAWLSHPASGRSFGLVFRGDTGRVLRRESLRRAIQQIENAKGTAHGSV